LEITNDKKYDREHVTIGLLTEWQNLYIQMIIEILGLGLKWHIINNSLPFLGLWPSKN
jgi:hypothetical protein